MPGERSPFSRTSKTNDKRRKSIKTTFRESLKTWILFFYGNVQNANHGN